MENAYSLVFGATGGIGKEFCKALAKRNENLFITGRNISKVELLREELLSINPKIKVLVKAVDLEDKDSRLDCFEFLTQNKVKVSGLYFIAGIDTRKAFEKYSEDKICMQARVNFESALSVTNYALKNRAKKLDVLVVSSACGLTAMPYFSVYSATKSALVYFYKGLKGELKGQNVKITIVCPGSVPTREDIVEDIKSQGLQGKLSKKSPEFVVKKSLKALKKNKTVFIPGFYNKFTNFLSKVTPYSIQSKIIAKKFANKEKDAF